jgi:glycosyltransferase involved in cell wall biosynthesis
LFKPAKKHDVLTMVYHGRLDEHRGLMAAVMFTHKARQAGIQVNLKMIGEGNIETKLERIAAEYDYIEMKPKMHQSKVAQEIGACHIGLLPMPDRTAWAIASPLKRSEYLASGLCVFGIDHEGHRLEGSGPWMKLVKQEDFHEQGLAYLRTFKNNSEPLFQGARAYAEKHAGWDIAISNLIEAIQ